eukprot:2709000-Amphidinium_carterae.1
MVVMGIESIRMVYCYPVLLYQTCVSVLTVVWSPWAIGRAGCRTKFHSSVVLDMKDWPRSSCRSIRAVVRPTLQKSDCHLLRSQHASSEDYSRGEAYHPKDRLLGLCHQLLCVAQTDMFACV